MDKTKTQSDLYRPEIMSSLGHLAIGLANELNNPLNFINGGVDCIKPHLLELKAVLKEFSGSGSLSEIKAGQTTEISHVQQLFEEVETMFSTIETGTRRALQIITDLRQYSFSDENEVAMVDLCACLDFIVEVTRDHWEGRIEIVKQYEGLPSILCNPGEVKQILIQVLLNAIEAIPEQGKITLAALRGDRQDEVTLAISDNGCGIPPVFMSQLFQPFFTTKVPNKGRGLGLCIVKKLLENNQGSISITSIPEQETVAKITLKTHRI